jgi:hypothetical protein
MPVQHLKWGRLLLSMLMFVITAVSREGVCVTVRVVIVSVLVFSVPRRKINIKISKPKISQRVCRAVVVCPFGAPRRPPGRRRTKHIFNAKDFFCFFINTSNMSKIFKGPRIFTIAQHTTTNLRPQIFQNKFSKMVKKMTDKKNEQKE